jgi:hypothetical protein
LIVLLVVTIAGFTIAAAEVVVLGLRAVAVGVVAGGSRRRRIVTGQYLL